MKVFKLIDIVLVCDPQKAGLMLLAAGQQQLILNTYIIQAEPFTHKAGAKQ